MRCTQRAGSAMDRVHSQHGYCTVFPQTTDDSTGLVETSASKFRRPGDDIVREFCAIRSGISHSLSSPELIGEKSFSKPLITRDIFLVRRDALNFNASFGTPVREVSFSKAPAQPLGPVASTFSGAHFVSIPCCFEGPSEKHK